MGNLYPPPSPLPRIKDGRMARFGFSEASSLIWGKREWAHHSLLFGGMGFAVLYFILSKIVVADNISLFSSPRQLWVDRMLDSRIESVKNHKQRKKHQEIPGEIRISKALIRDTLFNICWSTKQENLLLSLLREGCV